MACCTLSSSFLGVVLSVRVAFSKRSWPYLAASLPDLAFPVVEIVRWNDHSRAGPVRLRWTPEGWRAMHGDRVGDLVLVPSGSSAPENSR